MTHSQIGKALGLSRETVRRIERRAIAKLRKAMGSNYFGMYVIRDSEGIPDGGWDTREHTKAEKRREVT